MKSTALTVPKMGRKPVVPCVQGRANPYFIDRPKARVLLLQHIKENPGRYTVVDLAGITGVTALRINRLINGDTEFAKLAAKGAIAVPSRGARPRWFNKKTPIVSESFFKGAFAMGGFRLSGEKGATEVGMRLYDATRAALLSSNRAPHNIRLLQDGIKAELREQTRVMSERIRESNRAIAASQKLLDTNAALLAKLGNVQTPKVTTATGAAKAIKSSKKAAPKGKSKAVKAPTMLLEHATATIQ